MLTNAYLEKSSVFLGKGCGVGHLVTNGVTLGSLNNCERGKNELKSWMLEQPVKAKSFSSIHFLLKGFLWIAKL